MIKRGLTSLTSCPVDPGSSAGPNWSSWCPCLADTALFLSSGTADSGETRPLFEARLHRAGCLGTASKPLTQQTAAIQQTRQPLTYLRPFFTNDVLLYFYPEAQSAMYSKKFLFCVNLKFLQLVKACKAIIFLVDELIVKNLFSVFENLQRRCKI